MNDPNEKWLPLPMSPENYQISDKGRVWGNKRQHILQNQVNRDGYEQITTYSNGERIYFQVHRQVALAFYGNSNLTVNHKDGNTRNNCLTNLEFCSQKINNSYHRPHTKPNSKPLTKKQLTYIVEHPELNNGQLGRILNINRHTIKMFRNGKTFKSFAR